MLSKSKTGIANISKKSLILLPALSVKSTRQI
jgi:hypothetical protein